MCLRVPSMTFSGHSEYDHIGFKLRIHNVKTKKETDETSFPLCSFITIFAEIT